MILALFKFTLFLFLFTTSVARAESCSVSFNKIKSSGLCNMVRVKELQDSSLGSSSCNKRQLTKSLSFFTSCEKMAEETFSFCKKENAIEITQELISYISFIKEARSHLQSRVLAPCSKDEAVVSKLKAKGSFKMGVLASGIKGIKDFFFKKKKVKKEERALHKTNKKDFNKTSFQDKTKNKNIARNLTSLAENRDLLKEALLDENISGSIFYEMTYFQKSLCRNALKSGNIDGIKAACFKSINAAWFMNRDNSMSDATDGASKALYIFSSSQGTGVIAQICPGAFITVAHGITEDVLSYKGEALKKFLASSNGNRVRIYSFPLTSFMHLDGNVLNFEYFGTRLSKYLAWDDPSQDYLILKVNPSEAKAYAGAMGFNYNSKYYITPVSASAEEIKQASDNGQIDIHLYRGKPQYDWDEQAKTPVVDKNGKFDRDPSRLDFGRIFHTPQRVNERCEIGGSYSYSITNSCPSEPGVSGSPYIFKKNNKFYLVGIHKSGSGKRENFFSNNHRGGTMLVRSAAFCEDYEKACGKPCVTLKKVLAI